MQIGLEVAFLASIAITVWYMLKVRRGSGLDGLTGSEYLLVIITMLFGGIVVSGSIFYYGWKKVLPRKARAVLWLEGGLLAIMVLAYVLFAFWTWRAAVQASQTKGQQLYDNSQIHQQLQQALQNGKDVNASSQTNTSPSKSSAVSNSSQNQPVVTTTSQQSSPPITPKLFADPTTGDAPFGVTFYPNATPNAYSSGYLIDFGDGTSIPCGPICQPQSHTYTSAGSYVAKLDGVSANGKMVLATLGITVTTSLSASITSPSTQTLSPQYAGGVPTQYGSITISGTANINAVFVTIGGSDGGGTSNTLPVSGATWSGSFGGLTYGTYTIRVYKDESQGLPLATGSLTITH